MTKLLISLSLKMLNKEQMKIVKLLKKQYDFTNYIDIVRSKYKLHDMKLWLGDYYKLNDYLNSKIQEGMIEWSRTLNQWRKNDWHW